MDKLLITWIEDQIEKYILLSTRIMMAKVKHFFVILKEKTEPNYHVEFTASSGWFKQFKNYYSLNDVNVSSKSANAEEFLEILDKLIVEENYLPEQIVNIIETSQLWKQMAKGIFMHKKAKSMPGFKDFRDKIAVLFGAMLQTSN